MFNLLAGSKAFISQKRSFFAICDVSGYGGIKLDYAFCTSNRVANLDINLFARLEIKIR